MANNYARMGEGDLALECLDILIRSCLSNNFYTTHNDWRNIGIGVDLDWAPFQIDANMGWSAGVQEMLLFSLPGKISVLPALPKRWEKGDVKLMLAGRIFREYGLGRKRTDLFLKWSDEEKYILELKIKYKFLEKTIE